MLTQILALELALRGAVCVSYPIHLSSCCKRLSKAYLKGVLTNHLRGLFKLVTRLDRKESGGTWCMETMGETMVYFVLHVSSFFDYRSQFRISFLYRINFSYLK